MVAKQIEENEYNYKKSENVKVEVIPVVKGGERLTDEQVMQEKLYFVEGYFSVRFVDYVSPSSRTLGKSFDFIYQANTPQAKSAIKRLWSRYQRHFDSDYENFMGEIMAGVTEAVIQFNESQDTYDYSKMNEEGSKENQRLHAYIVKAGRTGISVLESHIHWYTNLIEWKKRSGAYIDGIDMTSFDAVVEAEDGEEITISEMLGEDSGLYAHEDGWKYDADKLIEVYHSNYHKPHFVMWWHKFLEKQRELRSSANRRTQAKAVLTQHQLDYLKVMSKYFVGELITGINLELESKDKNDEKVEALTYEQQKKAIEIENLKRRKNGLKPYKVYTQDDIYNYNSIIRERVIEEYNRQFPQGGLTFYGMRRSNEMEVLEEAYKIIYPPQQSGKIKKRHPKMEARQKELSKFILKNFKEIAIQDIVYERLDDEDQGYVIAALTSKGEIPSSTLSNFILEVADKLHELETGNEDLIYTGKPFEYVDSKKKRKKKLIRSEESKNGDVYVYDSQGNLKEVFTPKPMEKKYKERKATLGGLIDTNDSF